MKRLLIAALLTLLATPASAHAGIGDTHDFVSGFLHPLFGLDHFLAMTMLGAWAVMLGGRAVWMVPLAFILSMAAGGGLGFAGIALPFTETLILLSVAALALLLVVRPRMPALAAGGMAAAFALAHGFAHGAEMPADAAVIGYTSGFLIATALLHGTGMAAARLATFRPLRQR